MQTLIIISLVMLAIGFLGGIFYSSFKQMNGSGTPSQPGTPEKSQQVPQAVDRVPDLKKMVEQDPDNTDIWIELGNSYFDTNRYLEAIQAYQKALELSPENANVWTDLGVMFRRNDQPQKAIESFDMAVKADPNHEVSRFNKGIVLLYDLKDPEGALKAWEGLLKVNPFAKAPGGQNVAEIYEMVKKDRQK
ncbi:tetratricopeptide repeat protein [Thermodesulfobacteriota bacterium]